ncbi:hypothetical protein DPMN_080168 [Dreissena polymorpha]|uniref:Uncharacterized protein n=1 Tax=Dreissena polymorpha TaxID=45954 RepID=A0A9D3YVU9_DREPO|nr:hypothetical protein DPMN_080168 [Dreissena polymorpha]
MDWRPQNDPNSHFFLRSYCDSLEYFAAIIGDVTTSILRPSTFLQLDCTTTNQLLGH